MARTRLRQVEQIRNSLTYDDQLNSGDSAVAGAEGQPGTNIGANNAIVSTTTSTIVVAQNLIILGANADDLVTIAGSTSNDDTYIITSLSYSAPNTTITVVGTGLNGTILSAGGASGNAQVKVDSGKNLRRDLDFIRTQLRKLNQKPNWFDDPLADPTENYELKTGTAYAANTDIILSGGKTFDAGEPYTFKVYLNGQLMLPSTVSSNVVVLSHDYIERDSTQPVGIGEVGDRVRFVFDIENTDILQFKWAKSE
jgi:hypothetical protein